MAVSVVFNGTAHSIPSNRQAKGWGAALSAFLVDVGQNALSKAGGSFVLTGEVNFGATHGAVLAYLKSATANIAQSGTIRLARADTISFRNQANDGNLPLGVNSSDILTFNGVPVLYLALGSANHALKMNAGGTAYEFGLLGDDNLNTLSWTKVSKSGSNLTDIATRSHTSLTDIGTNSHANIDSHIASTSNPHSVTAGQVGLGNVDNTSDATKNAATATLTNKTVGDALTFTEVVTPSTPGAGLVKLYPKSDGNFYKIDDTGVEVAVGSGAGGSGEKNYVTNPSGSNNAAATVPTGWNNVGDVDVVVTKTAGELPREFTTVSGIKITADANVQSTADYVYYDFTLDDVDLSKKLKIKWDQKIIGTYAAGQLAVGITTQADRTTFLHTPVTTAIPAADGQFLTSFDASTTATLSLVIRATGDMTDGDGIVISDVVVGPGIITQGAVVSDWQSYTPAWTASSVNPAIGNGSILGKWRRVGSNMELQALVTSGTTTTYGTGTYRLSLPSGHTLDSSAYVNQTESRPIGLGTGFAIKLGGGGNQWFDVVVARASSTTMELLFTNADVGSTSSVGSANPSWTATTANQQISIIASVPIAEWAGSGTVNLAQNDVEYASNSDTSNDSNTTAFVYGPAGSTTPGVLTSNRDKRVRFLSPIQPTDQLVLEFSPSASGPWAPIIGTSDPSTGVGGYQFQNGTTAGITIRRSSISATDVDVAFGRYATLSGSTYGAAGTNWSTSTGFWRVKKVAGGAAVGFGAATSTASGLVSRETSGSFTGTLSGVSGTVTGTIQWYRIGKVVTLQVPGISGTSNSTSAIISGMPASIYPAVTLNAIGRTINNGSSNAGLIEIYSTNGNIQLYPDVPGNNFTNSGTKGVNPFSVSYIIP